jgi:hypothetical protein
MLITAQTILASSEFVVMVCTNDRSIFDTVPIVAFLRHCFCQHFETGGAMPDPHHSKRPITRIDQRISNVSGIESVILNKENVWQCSILRSPSMGPNLIRFSRGRRYGNEHSLAGKTHA